MQNTSLLHSDDGTISNLHHDIRSLESSLASLRSQTLQMELKLRELKEELLKAENTSTIQTPHQPHRSDDFSDRGDSRPLSPRQYQRYGRQMIVPGVGLGGQLKIIGSKVLIVGVGGLGCPAATYLAGAGVGKIGFIDGDEVELSNLHRQILHTEDGVDSRRKKVASAYEALVRLNSSIAYQIYPEHLSPTNALDIIKDYNIILDCTDHPTSRYLISDAAVLAEKPLVSASALQTEGQMMVLNNPPRKFNPAPTEAQPNTKMNTNEPANPAHGFCYRCVFPKPPPPSSVKSCGEGGILGPVVGVMGVLMAVEALKLIIWSLQSDASAPAPTMLHYNALDPTLFRTIRLKGRRANCAACSDCATISAESLTSESLDYVAFCGGNAPMSTLKAEERISAVDFHNLLTTKETPNTSHILIDVREEVQYEIAHLPGSINIPFSEFHGRNTGMKALEKAINTAHPPPTDTTPADPSAKDLSEEEIPLYFICRFGNDSQIAAKMVMDMQTEKQERVEQESERGEEKEKGDGTGSDNGDGDSSGSTRRRRLGRIRDIKGGLDAWRREVDGGFPNY